MNIIEITHWHVRNGRVFCIVDEVVTETGPIIGVMDDRTFCTKNHNYRLCGVPLDASTEELSKYDPSSQSSIS